MTSLSLEQANTLIASAFSRARELGLNPLTVAVLDPGGHLIALQRQGGSSNWRPRIAMAKASSALGLGVSSRRIGEMATERPSFVNALSGLAPDGLVPAAGGVIVVSDSGATLGAVGITGDLSDQDEACALAGIAAIGLQSQTAR